MRNAINIELLLTDKQTLVMEYKMINQPQRHCWCGNNELKNFSNDYLACTKCGTLVSQTGLESEQILVFDDNKDFYGREYWLSRQTQDWGYPDIYQRTRLDLPERNLHWLRTLLKYKLPGSRVLELGSAHGSFVALMRWAGFDGTGLELSPWVVDFAQKTFDIPMLLGRVEDQQLQPQSFDAIVLYDVLEHLPDPVATIQHCISLLKPDGILTVQTPNYLGDKTYAEMVANNDRFLEQLKAIEHLYLFNKRAIQMFFERLGFHILYFKPALFDYDMYFVVSRQPLVENTVEHISSSLATIPSGRMVQALLDKADEVDQFQKKWLVAEDDRAARLRVIEQLSDNLQVIEADRTARLQVINEQAAQIEQMEQHLQEIIEANHAAYLEVINKQAAQIEQMEQHLQVIEADRTARLQVINEQATQIEQMEQQLYNLQIQLPVRILRRLKLLKFQSISSSALMEE
ncbi:hypothetical protein A6769_05705 [Nostoc punctiforme NIES-2108]|uniref:Methyltransferase type 12 n=1 Tax=Nostoc punctiforme NIES-2108 TaxID=1356359 RepID=A0A367RRW0_NOSPU|nr:hypothetical protein A6769_05705 [Nostoc punctiforme NIES-2108]